MTYHILSTVFCLVTLFAVITPPCEAMGSGMAIFAEQPFEPLDVIPSYSTTLGKIWDPEAGHAAALFENPEDGSYSFVSIGSSIPFLIGPLKKDQEHFSNLDEAKKVLAHDGYTGIKTFQVENSDPAKAEEAINELSPIYGLTASAPVDVNIPTDNCLTSAIKVLKAYGVSDQDLSYSPLNPAAGSYGAPLDYFNQISGPTVKEYELAPDHTYLPVLQPHSEPANQPIENQNSLNQNSENSQKGFGGINFTSIEPTYISVNTDSSGGVNFDFLLKADKAEGASPRIDPINSTLISATAFMTGLEVPDNKFWVNLNPWEEDRIIDPELNQSEVGRIMLEADLQMKKDFSNYGNPCANETGKILWNLLDKKREALTQHCMEKFPGEIKNINNVWFLPVTRHWIVPDKVYAYTNGTQIYIINATLTINSEPVSEHSSFQVHNQDMGTLSNGCLEELNTSAKEYGNYYKELEDRMILPYVVADVNHGEKYEDLRDVYIALALAQWYKSRITPHMDIFRDSLESSRSALLESPRPWSANEIWDKYVYSFKNGEYKCWENTTINTANGYHTESSFRLAGGVMFSSIKDHLVEIDGMPPEVQDQINRAITEGYINEGKDTLFGNRLHVDQKKKTLITGSSSGTSSESLNSKHGAESPSNENRTDITIGLTNKKALGQIKETPPVAKVAGNSSHVTCPDGWMGPNEKGECWKLEIKGKS